MTKTFLDVEANTYMRKILFKVYKGKIPLNVSSKSPKNTVFIKQFCVKIYTHILIISGTYRMCSLHEEVREHLHLQIRSDDDVH